MVAFLDTRYSDHVAAIMCKGEAPFRADYRVGLRPDWRTNGALYIRNIDTVETAALNQRVEGEDQRLHELS